MNPAHSLKRIEAPTILTPVSVSDKTVSYRQIGAVTALILIGSVGSHFSPTYAALATATMATVIGPALVLAFAFNLPVATSSIDWIFWVGRSSTVKVLPDFSRRHF